MPDRIGPVHAAFSRLAVLAFRALGAAVRLAPPAAWGAAATAIAPVLWRCLPRYRNKAIENLLACGYSPAEARRIGRRSFRSNLLVFFEALAMPRLIARRRVRVESRVTPAAQAALARLKSGEEVLGIAVSGHTGVWEFLGAELARLAAPVPCAVAARFVKNPIIEQYLIRLRQSFGIQIVHKDVFLRHLLAQLRQRRPHIFMFLCDQHFKGGPRVPFLGRSACTVPVPASLMRKYGGIVIEGRCVRRAPGDYLIEIGVMDCAPFESAKEGAAVAAVTAAINRHIEESIRLAPEQWTGGHRRWRPCCQEPEAPARAGEPL